MVFPINSSILSSTSNEKDVKNKNEFLNINTKEDLELAKKIYKKNDFI